MFLHLTDFGYQRTPLQAFGWYLFWLVVVALGAGIIAGLLGLVLSLAGIISDSQDAAYALGLQIGAIIAVLAVIYISWKLLKAKHLANNSMWIVLSLVAVVATYFAGGLGGLIIPAIMTTRPSGTPTGNNNQQQQQ